MVEFLSLEKNGIDDLIAEKGGEFVDPRGFAMRFYRGFVQLLVPLKFRFFRTIFYACVGKLKDAPAIDLELAVGM